MTIRDSTGRWTAAAARTLAGVAAVRVTTAYAVALVAVSTTLTMLGPHAQDAVVIRMSTNLHNLARGRLSTLVGSAFVHDGGHVYAWLPGLVCLLALGELIWRSGGLLIAAEPCDEIERADQAAPSRSVISAPRCSSRWAWSPPLRRTGCRSL